MQSVRIGPGEHQALKTMAEETQRSMAELMSEAIENLRRKFIIDATNNAYRELRQDQSAWAEEINHRSQWERSTISDADLEDWK